MNKRLHIPKSILDYANNEAIDLLKSPIQRGLEMEFEQIKKEMLMEFLQHPVTQEIQSGPTASNISGTLSHGNLFSFIGFEAGSDPIAPIIQVIEDTNIYFYSRKKGEFLAKIIMPSAVSIFSVTPLPWANGRSWAKGIESGISGLGFYINKQDVGRSEAGVQLKGKVRSGSFKNTKYISHLISKYSKKFSEIKGVNITIK